MSCFQGILFSATDTHSSCVCRIRCRNRYRMGTTPSGSGFLFTRIFQHNGHASPAGESLNIRVKQRFTPCQEENNKSAYWPRRRPASSASTLPHAVNRSSIHKPCLCGLRLLWKQPLPALPGYAASSLHSQLFPQILSQWHSPRGR